MISLHEICQGLIKQWSNQERLKEGLALYYWPRIIGDQLADKIEAERLSNGILWLKTADPSLTQNLIFFKKQIMRKYNQILGSRAIRTVRIETGEVRTKRKNKDQRRPLELKEEFEVKIPESISKIKDEELRDAFSRFFRYHLSLRERRLMNGSKECKICGRLYEENNTVCFCQKNK
ncbi:MAG TPA: DUF721 domain-containing protein [Bacillota bacterium]